MDITLAACAFWAAMLDTAQPPTCVDRIRTTEPVVVTLLERGYRESSTFRELVGRIEQSDLHVYIRLNRDTPQTGLRLVAANGARTAWIWLVRDRGPEQLIARLAHELQHAAEIAGSPDVINDQTLAEYYRRHGFSRGAGSLMETHESPAAQGVERAVFKELVGRR